MGMGTPVGYLYWYTTSIILGILTLLNIASHLVHTFLTKRYCSPAVLPSPVAGFDSPSSDTTVVEGRDEEKGSLSAATPRSIGTVHRLGRAAITGWNKYALLTAVHMPTTNRLRGKRAAKSFMPTSDLAWTLGYLLGCMVLTFYGSE
jgi:hypothetical protein